MFNLIPIFIVGFTVYGTYAIIELFARRKERMAIIEKLSGGIDPESLKHQLGLFKNNENTSWPIRIGCLLAGIGLGTLIVAIVELLPLATSIRAIETMYLSSAALFGGIGLISAFFLERKLNKRKQDDEN